MVYSYFWYLPIISITYWRSVLKTINWLSLKGIRNFLGTWKEMLFVVQSFLQTKGRQICHRECRREFWIPSLQLDSFHECRSPGRELCPLLTAVGTQGQDVWESAQVDFLIAHFPLSLQKYKSIHIVVLMSSMQDGLWPEKLLQIVLYWWSE